MTPHDSFKSRTPMPQAWAFFFMIVGVLLSHPSLALSAETTTPEARSKTVIAVTLDANESIAVRSKSLQRPPRILIEFPSKRVTGTLPEQSTIGRGVVQTIRARYQRGGKQGERFVQAIEVVLRDTYPSRVRSEPGRIVIEIDHPASVNRMDMEVGLRGGTIIGARAPLIVSQRFSAMQEALTKASPISWTTSIVPGPQESPASLSPSQARIVAANESDARLAKPPTSSAPRSWISRNVSHLGRPSPGFWGILVLSLGLGIGGAWAWIQRRQSGKSPRSPLGSRSGSQLSAGMTLIDQLVWRAFERQGYQLVVEKGLLHPPGTLRVMIKEGTKRVLLCAANGPFFEKQTIERFIGTMKEARVDQGFLVAAGSFTVPAQRVAKEQGLTLIGREELIELLSTGAASEYVTSQLEQQRARLDEAKETLQQYAKELDTLRRQRNESSWFLGEERAKSAKLESETADLAQQLRHANAQRERTEREAQHQRKQWEESEWYLGESRMRIQHVEAQLDALQAIAERLANVTGERDETLRRLEETRASHETLERSLTDAQQALETALAREQELQETLQQLQGSMALLREESSGRRQHKRVLGDRTFIELHQGKNGPMFAGSPQDVSPIGFRVETERRVSPRATLRVRLHLPSAREPFESTAKLIWQRAATTSSRYQSGYALLDLSEEARDRLRALINQDRLLKTESL